MASQTVSNLSDVFSLLIHSRRSNMTGQGVNSLHALTEMMTRDCHLFSLMGYKSFVKFREQDKWLSPGSPLNKKLHIDFKSGTAGWPHCMYLLFSHRLLCFSSLTLIQILIWWSVLSVFCLCTRQNSAGILSSEAFET